VGDSDFKVKSVAENSNKFQNTRFWKENSVEDMVRVGSTAQAILVLMKFAEEHATIRGCRWCLMVLSLCWLLT
jgi:hypothetical protein